MKSHIKFQKYKIITKIKIKIITNQEQNQEIMSFTNDKCEVSFNDINGNGKSIQYYDREDGWVKTPQLKKRGRVTAEIKEPAWSGSEAEFSIYLENGGYAKFRVGCPTFSDNYC